MDVIIDLLVFLIKTVIVVGVIVSPLILISLGFKQKSQETKTQVELVDLKEQLISRKERLQKQLKEAKLQTKIDAQKEEQNKKKISALFKLKKEDKESKKDLEQEHKEYIAALEKKQSEGVFCPENLFVINFKGSTKGSEVKKLRAQIDAILDVATDKDEVVVNLSSPGGLVNSYGLCASQLIRLKDRGIRLVCTVDSVAASGGYLMACVADKIVAAPFAYIGSIGVIASVPNFRRLLEKHDIDYEQVTSGKYKRTLSVFGQNTQEGRRKFKEELAAIHERFKEQVLKYRPNIDIEKIATGEHWLAVDAKELGLVDEIKTSDEYIASRAFETFNCVMKVEYKQKKDQSLLLKFKNLVTLKAFAKNLKKDLIEQAESQDFMHIK